MDNGQYPLSDNDANLLTDWDATTRKSACRESRNFICVGVPVHVVQRGNDRQPVFYDEQDYRHYRAWLREGAARCGCVVHTLDQNGSASTAYLHYDQLGSVDAITDDSGAVIQSMSFDAFGQRRDAGNWDYDLSQNQIATLKDYTDRGYTDQEQLDNLSLVDLNGRVYDPTVGRVISADPTIPDPGYSQAFDRYTYVYNSPLIYTDPSGFDADACPKKQSNSGNDNQQKDSTENGTGSDQNNCSDPNAGGDSNNTVMLGTISVTANYICPAQCQQLVAANELTQLMAMTNSYNNAVLVLNSFLGGRGSSKASVPAPTTPQHQQSFKTKACNILNFPGSHNAAISIDLGGAAGLGADIHLSLGIDSVNIFLGGGYWGRGRRRHYCRPRMGKQYGINFWV